MKEITKSITSLLLLSLGLYGIAQLAMYSMRIIHITQAQGTEAQLISILGFSIIAAGVLFLTYKLKKWDKKRKSNLAISETKKDKEG